ncbi:MAG: hypothetical protein ACRCZP_17345 [Phycicoccus sp.]
MTTTETYYRIQPAARPVADLLDADLQVSRAWEALDVECGSCQGHGTVLGARDEETGDYAEDTCDACDGSGRVEDVRQGISVCRSVDDLCDYFAERVDHHDDYVSTLVMVELEGRLSEDDDHDHGTAGRPLLILPSAVVAVTPVPAELAEAMRWDQDQAA